MYTTYGYKGGFKKLTLVTFILLLLTSLALFILLKWHSLAINTKESNNVYFLSEKLTHKYIFYQSSSCNLHKSKITI